jgi:serine protease Do
MTARRLFAALLLSVFLAPAAPAQGFLSDRASAKIVGPFRSVVAKASASTVRVRCDDKDAALGAVVFDEGFVLTKASELRGKITCRLPDGTEYDADLVSTHRDTDLALLKVDVRGMKPVKFADSKKVPTGNWLAAAGPSSDPVGVGIVSVATRTLRGADAEYKLNNNRGFLGVSIDDFEEKGAKVIDLTPGGAAAKAGIKKDDVITEVAGKLVKSREALQELMGDYRPGESVALRVSRAGETLKMTITLTKSPLEKSRGEIQNSMGSELSGRRTGFPSILQSDMILDPKNCGGPVVDLDGNVIGVGIARAGRVESWVLPSENIRPLLSDMRSGKYPPLSVHK